MERLCDYIMRNVIEIENVSFAYNSYVNRVLYLKERLFHRDNFRSENILLFRNINLEVRQGDILGILGKNGVGKSTFLKLVSGVYSPQKGRVVRNGTICPLIELGAAFHNELNGLENLRMFSAFLNMSDRLNAHTVEKIIHWTNFSNQIYSPLRTYSSGMIARLAFSTAIHLRPEVLVLDEVLSVGDQDFKNRARLAVNEYIEFGGTVLLVSHDLELIREMANRVIVISNEGVEDFVSPSEGIDYYLSLK